MMPVQLTMFAVFLVNALFPCGCDIGPIKNQYQVSTLDEND